MKPPKKSVCRVTVPRYPNSKLLPDGDLFLSVCTSNLTVTESEATIYTQQAWGFGSVRGKCVHTLLCCVAVQAPSVGTADLCKPVETTVFQQGAGGAPQ